MNKKAVSPLVATILLISFTIIMSVVITYLIRGNEQRYCKNNPNDCEIKLVEDYDGTYWDWTEVYKYTGGISEEKFADAYNKRNKISLKGIIIYDCRIAKDKKRQHPIGVECKEGRLEKKNPCQLKLEKFKDEENKLALFTGDLLEKETKYYAENCICEEEITKTLREVGSCMILDYTNGTLISNNCDTEFKECSKARPKTEFELNPNKFICERYELCNKDFDRCEEIIKEEDGVYYYEGGYIVERNKNKFFEKCLSWREKNIEDMSCQELESIYPLATPLGKYDQYSKEDINHRMILKGCGND